MAKIIAELSAASLPLADADLWRVEQGGLPVKITKAQMVTEIGGGGIADGTVTNATLRWSGSAWVETLLVQTSAAGDLIATSYGGILEGDLLSKIAAETITANWIMDVSANGPHLHIKGGVNGTPLARFERDIGGVAQINIHASNARPAITFDRATGANLWTIGGSGTDSWVVSDDSDLADPVNYRLEIDPTTMTFNTRSNAASRLTLGEATTLRGDSQEGTLDLYGEDSGTIFGARIAVINNGLHIIGIPGDPVQSLQIDLSIGLEAGNVLFIADGIILLHSNAGGDMLTLKDSGGAGATANPIIRFDDSAFVRQGYVGFGSTGDQDMYLVADIGDVNLDAGSGIIRLQDEARTQDGSSDDNITGMEVQWRGSTFYDIGLAVMPDVIVTGAITLSEIHMHKTIRITSGTGAITFASDTGMALECVGWIMNESGSNNQLTATATINWMDGAGGQTGNRQLADGGWITWWKRLDGTYYIQGSGLS